jgi:hypothetical protein
LEIKSCEQIRQPKSLANLKHEKIYTKKHLNPIEMLFIAGTKITSIGNEANLPMQTQGQEVSTVIIISIGLLRKA